MRKFQLISNYEPAGDQVKAIYEIDKRFNEGIREQVLEGVTGSGKTFTMANIIVKQNKQTIILSHNKTLASQLYSEMKMLFPNNRVEYFVSYFDYYKPEAYLPAKDVYIGKTSQTNLDLEAMRMSAFNALIMREDTIVIASVASIYCSRNPEEYRESFFNIEVNQNIKLADFFKNLVKMQYSRNKFSCESGTFYARGDIVDICPSWTNDFILRVEFFGDIIESISKINRNTKKLIKKFNSFVIFPQNAYVVEKSTIDSAIKEIEKELESQLNFFKNEGKLLEYQRLKERVNNDIDSLREFGFCSGIENYARHIDKRDEGLRPFTILDFLAKGSLLIIDESHMMIPQLHAMYHGDRSRKENLVNYGFRLPSALDNRPLRFDEFKNYDFNTLYVSATPSDYELNQTNKIVTSQIIRPTGLLEPIIEIRKEENQVEDIYDEILKQIDKKERSLIITTTKKTAEEFTKYFQAKKIKIAYIHSEHKTFERNEILRKLRKGIYDVLIGINLLREGIDLPEVSLIMVLDANKESFFRSKTALIQIAGRASRNINGRVIFYGDTISKSMNECINDNKRKREIQIEYNNIHHIIPKGIVKPILEPIENIEIKNEINDLLKNKKTKKEKNKVVESLKKEMMDAAKKMDFERAATLRDLIFDLEIDS